MSDVTLGSPPALPPTISAAGLRPTAPRAQLPDLLRMEWIKLRSVRSTVWTLAVTVVVGVGVTALACAVTHARWDTLSPAARAGFEPTRLSLTSSLFGQLALGVLGTLVMSAEYGTGTIRATFTAAPRRLWVLAAKVLVFGVVALVVAEVTCFASFFVGQALLTAPAHHATLATPGALRSVVGTGLYLCVIGLFALGLATVIRHTAGAISAFVGILLVLPIVVEALPQSWNNDISRFLPLQMGGAFLDQGPNPGQFSPWVGLAVLCGYAAGALLLGAFLLVRRDA